MWILGSHLSPRTPEVFPISSKDSWVNYYPSSVGITPTWAETELRGSSGGSSLVAVTIIHFIFSENRVCVYTPWYSSLVFHLPDGLDWAITLQKHKYFMLYLSEFITQWRQSVQTCVFLVPSEYKIIGAMCYKGGLDNENSIKEAGTFLKITEW